MIAVAAFTAASRRPPGFCGQRKFPTISSSASALAERQSGANSASRSTRSRPATASAGPGALGSALSAWSSSGQLSPSVTTWLASLAMVCATLRWTTLSGSEAQLSSSSTLRCGRISAGSWILGAPRILAVKPPKERSSTMRSSTAACMRHVMASAECPRWRSVCASSFTTMAGSLRRCCSRVCSACLLSSLRLLRSAKSSLEKASDAIAPPRAK
mmetsp:Transcript_16878/g.64274  ORF Transcript_16878/g.64274 Transcript_16878/m.64274 type:complete len:215 (+) Transcript_16878:1507-2151(+)